MKIGRLAMNKWKLFIITLCFVGCNKSEKTIEKDVSREIVQPLSEKTVILEYNGGVITAKDVNEAVAPQLELARQQLLQSYSKFAEDVLLSRMQDKESQESNTASDNVSDTELAAYIKANNIPKAESEKIRTFLLQEKKRIGKQVMAMDLYKKLNVKNHLAAIQSKIDVTDKMPKVGKDDALITIQLFCDFGNPSCNRSRLALAQLKNEMGDKVRWVYRHFPVASSSIGVEAAKISICAHKQNKFWKIHDYF